MVADGYSIEIIAAAKKDSLG